MTRKLFLHSGAAVMALMAPMQAVYGQANDPRNDEAATSTVALEEVFVTARKQSESALDVPATINVVTSDMLATRQTGSGFELSGLVPGLQLTNAIGGFMSPTIRGLGSNTAVFSIEASVATFFDGTYAAHPRDLASPFFDIERLEVIKGTQSTTLGKNTTLGAMSFVSRRPGSEFGMDLRATHEMRFDTTRLEGGVDIPLADTLKVRVSGYTSNEEGFIENRLRDVHEPTRKFDAGRLVAVLEPSPNFSATLIYQHDTYEMDGQNVSLLSDSPTGVIQGLANAIGQTNFDVQKGVSYNGYGTRPPFDRQRSDRTTLISELDLGDFTLTSHTAYVYWKNNRRFDLDFVDASLLTLEIEEPNQLFSQEFRIASPADKRVSYLAGVYYVWNEWGHDQLIIADAPWPLTGAVTHFTNKV
ncbi:TonB-dependent receptor plug domain-containing protein [Kineobactrum salinum]|uniref:TonB-dependent receptor plug domain-containing protein n=1 Tax=Kineobactrum salinum TaxID=2708301 RepID=A0A6C0TWH2_9GAMM|nr:TonB-dependent receptor plug domain-containing protein [Kineobactrum salinum]QIB64126.1 TonB-dependent receptor plug domain-containing protein [Kineobactrum salinum]